MRSSEGAGEPEGGPPRGGDGASRRNGASAAPSRGGSADGAATAAAAGQSERAASSEGTSARPSPRGGASLRGPPSRSGTGESPHLAPAPEPAARAGERAGGRREHDRAVSIRLRYAVCSSGGRRSSGARKTNQDAHGILPRVCGLSYAHVFFVADGHGKYGELVSGLVRARLQGALEHHLRALPADSLLHNPSRRLSARDVRVQIPPLAEALQATCLDLNDQARHGADTSLSGTTLVVALLIGAHGVFANVGDSRCILGYLRPNRDRPPGSDFADPQAAPPGPASTPSSRTSSSSQAGGADSFAPLRIDAAGRGRPRPPQPAPPQPSSVADSTDSPVAGAFPRNAAGDSEDEDGGGDSAAEQGGAAATALVARLEREAAAVTSASVLTARAITIDQTPDAESERPRIEAQGGLVQPHFNQVTKQFVGPQRVWSIRYPGYPGLAMGRSIGDDVAADCGVICDPVISYQHLRPGRDMWLIIASDGVWEVMGNDDAIRIAQAAPCIEDAAIQVCQEANQRWEHSCTLRGSLMIDDITAIVIHLWPDRSAVAVERAVAAKRDALLARARSLRASSLDPQPRAEQSGTFASHSSDGVRSSTSSSGTRDTVPNARAAAAHDNEPPRLRLLSSTELAGQVKVGGTHGDGGLLEEGEDDDDEKGPALAAAAAMGAASPGQPLAVGPNGAPPPAGGGAGAPAAAHFASGPDGSQRQVVHSVAGATSARTAHQQ